MYVDKRGLLWGHGNRGPSPQLITLAITWMGRAAGGPGHDTFNAYILYTGCKSKVKARHVGTAVYNGGLIVYLG